MSSRCTHRLRYACKLGGGFGPALARVVQRCPWMRQRADGAGECGWCGKEVRAGAALYIADGQLACALCYTKIDIDTLLHGRRFDRAGTALAGAGANLIPFVAQAIVALIGGAFGSAVASAIDACALLAGVAAVLCGAATVAAARASARSGWLVVGALVAVIGGYHVVRSAGMIG